MKFDPPFPKLLQK